MLPSPPDERISQLKRFHEWEDDHQMWSRVIHIAVQIIELIAITYPATVIAIYAYCKSCRCALRLFDGLRKTIHILPAGNFTANVHLPRILLAAILLIVIAMVISLCLAMLFQLVHISRYIYASMNVHLRPFIWGALFSLAVGAIARIFCDVTYARCYVLVLVPTICVVPKCFELAQMFIPDLAMPDRLEPSCAQMPCYNDPAARGVTPNPDTPDASLPWRIPRTQSSSQIPTRKIPLKKKPSEQETYYRTLLGITGTATPADLRRAYLTLAQKHHPDNVRHLGGKAMEVAEGEMKELEEAYEYLLARIDESRAAQ